MTRIIITLEYRDNFFVSDTQDLTKKEYKNTIIFIEKIAEGKALSFSMRTEDKELIFFGKEILKESIIKIIEINS